MPAKRKPPASEPTPAHDTVIVEFAAVEMKDKYALINDLLGQGYTVQGYSANGALRSVLLVKAPTVPIWGDDGVVTTLMPFELRDNEKG